LFAVVDVETTGSFAKGNAMTEIAIAVTDGQKIIQEYNTLLNPLQPIPYAIQRLTGIDDNLVAEAPKFAEVAQEIREVLADHIFVAHNVNFDLGFVQSAFSQLGMVYKPRRLCTVRYARRIIKGLKSYSLASLCKHFNYQNEQAHRACADTEVTAKILHQLLAQDTQGQWQNMIKVNQGELNLPANLPAKEFHDLPMAAGVYYFYNQQGEILYVGKASKLKSRVASHFTADKTTARSAAFKREIAHIHYRLCGNIMIAGLLEDHEIRRLWPPYNRAQKNPKLHFGVFAYTNQNGDWCLGINKIGQQQAFIAKFHSLEKARTWLAQEAEQRGLEPSLCGFPQKSDHPIEHHNQRVEDLIKELKMCRSSQILIGEGRESGEHSFAYLSSQGFQGIGFVPREVSITKAEDLEPYLEPLNRSATTEGILREGQKKLKLSLIELSSEIPMNGQLF